LKNESTLNGILAEVKGEAITHPYAVKKEIFSDLKDYSILYLTTHSLEGNLAEGGPFLAFTRADTFDRSDFLYAREVLQYDLPLDLVFLNSCASSSGTHLSGEGTYSLSRSFAYAGSQSVVATLWPIDNTSASQLSTYFFGALRQGLSKDEALREAKLRMLENGKSLRAHPYFWAAHTHFGNRTPLWKP